MPGLIEPVLNMMRVMLKKSAASVRRMQMDPAAAATLRTPSRTRAEFLLMDRRFP